MNNSKGGYSLVELIVSVAIFTLIITVALGALLMVIDANRKAKGIKLVVNNLNLAMESMSRELRVGSNICENESGVSCNTSSNGATEIFFTTDRGEDDSSFRFVDGAVWRRIGPDGPSNPYLKLTGSDVVVEDMRFFIRGADSSTDSIQPSVMIVLNGTIGFEEETVDFNLQTVVSQRKLDL